MPQQAAPHWSKSANCWYANIGPADKSGRAKEVYFREPIGEPAVPVPRDHRDKGGAWDWLRAYKQAQAVRHVDPSSMTVEIIFQMYLDWAEKRVAEESLSSVHQTNQEIHLSHFSKFAPPGEARYGTRLAKDIDHHHLQYVVDSWRKSNSNPDGFSPNYIKNIVGSVTRAFSWAASPAPGRPRTRLIASNPLEKFVRPKVPYSPERFAERSTAAAFLKFYRNHADRQEKFKVFTAESGTVSLSRRKTTLAKFERITIMLERFLIGTGCRPGEACVLEWRDIKWNAGTNKAGHAYAKAIIPFDRWKTGEKTGKSRTIYINPRMTKALRRMHLKPDRHPIRVFTHGRGRGGKGAGEPWESGSRLSKVITRVRRAAIDAIESGEAKRKANRADLLTPAERAVEGLRISDEGPGRIANYLWRHTAASAMLMMGIDPTTVAELLGTSVDMIKKHYGHILDSHLAEAADKFAGGRIKFSSHAS